MGSWGYYSQDNDTAQDWTYRAYEHVDKDFLFTSLKSDEPEIRRIAAEFLSYKTLTQEESEVVKTYLQELLGDKFKDWVDGWRDSAEIVKQIKEQLEQF